jgi:hypothetical protein
LLSIAEQERNEGILRRRVELDWHSGCGLKKFSVSCGHLFGLTLSHSNGVIENLAVTL